MYFVEDAWRERERERERTLEVALTRMHEREVREDATPVSLVDQSPK